MMRMSLKLWAIAAAVALFTSHGKAAEPAAPPLPKESKSWWTDFSVSPYGAVKHPDFGAPVWGAGLDLGYSINHSLSVHLANSIFDYPNGIKEGSEGSVVTEGGWWSGAAIDETELLFRADLIKTGGQGKDRFVGYVIGGGSRDWTKEDWGFGVGAGAEVRFSKNLSLGADSRLRAWFNEPKDVITRVFASYRF